MTSPDNANSDSLRSLAGKSVVITGAARGLGRDYARLFAAEGASVAIADIDPDGVAATAEQIAADFPDVGVVPVVVDVSDPESTAAMASTVKDALGAIHILVNNAGIWGDLEPTPLNKLEPKYWDLVIGVNLHGPLLCAQAVLPAMREAGFGRIINISSMGAYMPSSVYGVSKMGLNSMTYALATELGPEGITVNGVAPGPIDNEATRGQLPEAVLEKMRNGTALKRMGSGNDLFGMVRYLATEEAGWVTGQTIQVNGGYDSRL